MSIFKSRATKQAIQLQLDVLKAISSAQAMIEFSLDGLILTANQNFLELSGYALDEILGQSHSMFVESSYSKSIEYQQFWAQLRQGQAGDPQKPCLQDR